MAVKVLPLIKHQFLVFSESTYEIFIDQFDASWKNNKIWVQTFNASYRLFNIFIKVKHLRLEEYSTIPPNSMLNYLGSYLISMFTKFLKIKHLHHLSSLKISTVSLSFIFKVTA